MKNNKENKITEDENTTNYGEFITSYFAWVLPEKQKERAEEMENMTKKDKNK